MERKRYLDNSIKLYADYGIWFFLVAIVIIMSFASDKFLVPSNITNILRSTITTGIVAVGMTYVMISGNFDLSVGATITFGCVLAMTMDPSDARGTVLAIIVPVLAGAVIGVINGTLVGYLRLNPFITTLGMQFVVLATSQIYVGGRHLWVPSKHIFFESLANGFFLGVPISMIILIILVIVAQLVLSYTNYGIYLKVSGENRDAARLSGVKVEKIVFFSFLLVSILAGLSGSVLASWVRDCDPSSTKGYEFDIITAVVLGGTSLLGGRGNVANTFAGVLILQIIVNAMLLLGIAYQYQLMVRGIVLITAVSLEIIVKRVNR